MREVRKGLEVSALLGLLVLPAHADDPSTDSADSYPTCGDIELLATAEELAATPRERIDVEYQALEQLGTGFTVDPATYRRVLADTDAIRALVPAVSHITYFDRDQTSHNFLLKLDDPTHAAVLAGTFTGWNCLNDWYGVETTNVLNSIPWAVMETRGAYDLNAMITQ
ncbi:MAG: hypothetical protein GY773_07050, partial [Actinomycetia bacterium]|nr:hypothetical protein [Actinomycetes bacterium]